MKLLLDTTYLLPIVGISVKGVPTDALIKLNTAGHRLAVSQIIIFELSAKSAKYVMNHELSAERVTRGIRALIYDDIVEKIPIHNTKVLLAAFLLRSEMNDFIDCLILATALIHCDLLVTEDNEIHNLKKNKKYLELLSTTNPNFKIQNYRESENLNLK